MRTAFLVLLAALGASLALPVAEEDINYDGEGSRYGDREWDNGEGGSGRRNIGSILPFINKVAKGLVSSIGNIAGQISLGLQGEPSKPSSVKTQGSSGLGLQMNQNFDSDLGSMGSLGGQFSYGSQKEPSKPSSIETKVLQNTQVDIGLSKEPSKSISVVLQGGSNTPFGIQFPEGASTSKPFVLPERPNPPFGSGFQVVSNNPSTVVLQGSHNTPFGIELQGGASTPKPFVLPEGLNRPFGSGFQVMSSNPSTVVLQGIPNTQFGIQLQEGASIPKPFGLPEDLNPPFGIGMQVVTSKPSNIGLQGSHNGQITIELQRNPNEEITFISPTGESSHISFGSQQGLDSVGTIELVRGLRMHGNRSSQAGHNRRSLGDINTSMHHPHGNRNKMSADGIYRDVDDLKYHGRNANINQNIYHADDRHNNRRYDDLVIILEENCIVGQILDMDGKRCRCFDGWAYFCDNMYSTWP